MSRETKQPFCSEKFRFSFSQWEDYSGCPRRWRFKNIDLLPTSPIGSAGARGLLIHDQVDAYVSGDRDMPPDITHHLDVLDKLRESTNEKASEDKREFNAEWKQNPKKAPDTSYVLIMDAWERDGSHLHIFEWKTGKPKDSHAEQRKFYITGGFALFEVDTIKATTYYLDGTSEPCTTNAKRSAIDKLIPLWQMRRQTMLDDNFYPPRPGNQCNWCDFSKRKGGPCDF
jgi:hypothetical protein